MAHYDVIIKQKQALRERILKNQDIVNLLMNTGDNVLAFENVKTGSKSPAAKFVRSHFYVPDTTTTDGNFITMRSRIIRADTDVVKSTGIVVYVICNRDQIELKQGSRADLIADEIDKILNNGEDPIFGFGGIRVGSSEEVQFNDGYSGWEMPFVTKETNREAPIL